MSYVQFVITIKNRLFIHLVHNTNIRLDTLMQIAQHSFSAKILYLLRTVIIIVVVVEMNCTVLEDYIISAILFSYLGRGEMQHNSFPFRNVDTY